MSSPPTSFSLTGWICHSCRSRIAAQRLPKASTRRWGSTRRPDKQRLPDSPARTRFAPSPTGTLHLGSIRTALFNYLLARRTGGKFLLRIEDTDQKRTVQGAEEQLYKDLQWAGLEWDEGPTLGGDYGPYRQSERTKLYREHSKPLLNSGRAYRCFCTAERIDNLNRSRHARGLPLGYDRRCLHLPSSQAEERARKGESFVVRFQVPKVYPKFRDLVYGETGQGAARIQKLLLDEPVYDDPVLVKSDGFPTYHFASVVDDHLMHISHVVRGSEWMSSTPLHVALYNAFEWTPPLYAHVPLLVDHEGQKLSKRNFNSDISIFREQNIFPDALVNFAALLGWSHTGKNDVMNLQELVEAFDLKITKGNTIVALEKLNFLQEQHAKRRIAVGGEDFEQMIRNVASALLSRHGAAKIIRFTGPRKLRDVVASMLRAESLPYRSPTQFAISCDIFFKKREDWDTLQVSDTSRLRSVRTAAATLNFIPEAEWHVETIRANMLAIATEPTGDSGQANERAWRKEFYHYLRWALLGNTTGPALPQTMEILGRSTCLERVQAAALYSKDLEVENTRPALQAALIAK